MRTAIDGRPWQGARRQRSLHGDGYVFEPEFCNPASGWEKVEKNVQDARHRFF
jgi:hypothetical protein